MEDLTNIIATEIKRQYKSVRQFSMKIGVPQTTVASALKNGVNGTAYDTIIKICRALDIKLVNYDTHIVMNDTVLDAIEKFNKLDEIGIHTVNAVLDAEYARCTDTNNPLARRPRIGSYAGVNVMIPIEDD